MAGWAALSAGVAAGLAALLAGVGTVTVLAAVVFRRPALVTAGVTTVGVASCFSAAGAPVDTRAALQGIALLAAAELAFWSIDLHGSTPGDPDGHRPRWNWLGALLLAAAVVSGGVVVVAVAVSPAGLGWTATAALAAVAVGSLLAVLARSPREYSGRARVE